MAVKLIETNFEQEVLRSEVPVLVDFWAEWCIPCVMITPIVNNIAKEYEGKVKVCKLNVDDAPQIASRYGVMSIPTLALFVDGKLMDRIIGVVPEKQIVRMLKKYMKQDGE